MNIVKNSFILLLIFFATIVYGQNNRLGRKDSLKPFICYSDKAHRDFIFGFRIRGIALFGKDSTRLKRQNASVLRWEPYCAYFPVKNLGFGIFGVIEHFQSNYLQTAVPTVYEYGLFTRYFIPFKFNSRSFLNRISLSVELSFSKSNYIMKSKYYIFGSAENYTVLPKMTQTIVKIPFNIHVRLYKELFAVFTVRYENYMGSYIGLIPMFGIEYKF